jgi:hypothetical protein
MSSHSDGLLEALRRRGRGCPHPDVIAAAGMDVLEAHESARVRTHIASCDLCHTLHETFATAHAADDARVASTWTRTRAKVRKSSPLRLAGYFMAAAAALIIAVTSGVFLPRGRPNVQPVDVAPPVYVLPLEKAPLKLPLDSLTWRSSEESSSSPYLTELGQALEPYHRNEFSDAVHRLAQLAKRYPQRVEPAFYIGVSELFLNRPSSALQALGRARELGGAALVPDIAWYEAIAHEREQRPQQTATLLEELCASDNPYQKQSCEARPRLMQRVIAP